MIDPELIHRIVQGYELPLLGTHGLPHWARVLETGLRLAEHTGADRRVVALFAVFHDSRRRNEAVDDGHGARGAALAQELRSRWLDLTDEQFALLTTACVHHTDGTVEGDVTVRTCWDADRLDLWRVRIEPRDRYLCTDAARNAAIRQWARERSLGDFTPDYVDREWIGDR